MSGMLVQSIWFPADSRLTVVNPGAVFQLITARGEPAALDIYDDRRIVGNVTITSSRLSKDLPHPIKLKWNGQIELSHPLLTGRQLKFSSWVDLDRDGRSDSFSLDLSLTRKDELKLRDDFNLTFSQTGPEAPPSLRISNGASILFDSAGISPDQLDRHPMVSVVLATLGISLKDLSAIRDRAANEADKLVMEARQGKFDLEGKQRQGFVIKLGRPGQPGFRLCVENTGEIVQLETPTSFHFLSESLRPLPPTP
jgi:hypothetical protein